MPNFQPLERAPIMTNGTGPSRRERFLWGKGRDERILQVEATILRLYQLPDRFLARALRDMARSARKELGERYEQPLLSGYGTTLLWTTLPGMAAMLGETEFTPTEIDSMTSLPKARAALRRHVGLCLENSEIRPKTVLRHDTPCCWLISSEFVNGNPVTIALDRVAPPEHSDTDWVTRHMREVSRARFGHDDTIMWTPAFNPWKMGHPDLEQTADLDLETVHPIIEADDPDVDLPVP